jgi:hypothetical protein
MTRTFQRITSLILISVALSLNGCKTGDTSLDKLVSSVSDATSGQPSDPLTKRKTDSLCKKFKPFLVGFFSVKFKSGEISEEIQKRKVSPESCMKMAGLSPPKPLSAYSAQSLCKKFQPFSTSQFSVSFKSNDIAAAVKQKGLSPEACMKMAGLSPPKPLSAYDLKSICNFSDFDALIIKEKKRRNVSSLYCQITRGIALKEQDYLSKTPSKRVTPFLTGLDLCRFLKYKKPPHLKAAVKKRRLRCDRLLSLDEFERSVN